MEWSVCLFWQSLCGFKIKRKKKKRKKIVCRINCSVVVLSSYSSNDVGNYFTNIVHSLNWLIQICKSARQSNRSSCFRLKKKINLLMCVLFANFPVFPRAIVIKSVEALMYLVRYAVFFAFFLFFFCTQNNFCMFGSAWHSCYVCPHKKFQNSTC